MNTKKKVKYISKTVAFQGKQISLFSIDGITWSTRKQELMEIKERQERDKVSFAAIKEENGETKVVPKPATGASNDEEEEGEEGYEAGAESEGEETEAVAEVDENDEDSKRAPRKKAGKPTPVKTAPQVKGKVAPAVKSAAEPKKAIVTAKVSPKKRETSKPVAKPQAKGKSRQKAA